MHTYESLIDRFWEVGVSDTFGTGREIAALPKLLDDDEVVHYATSGLMGGNTWLIVCTDRRVLMVDKGFFFGIKTQEIPLDMIHSVSGSKGMLLGTLQIFHGSSSIVIERVGRNTVDPMKKTINDQMSAFKKSQQSYAIVDTSPSPAAQVRELKELLDDGLLTPDEFDVKRREILGL